MLRLFDGIIRCRHKRSVFHNMQSVTKVRRAVAGYIMNIIYGSIDRPPFGVQYTACPVMRLRVDHLNSTEASFNVRTYDIMKPTLLQGRTVSCMLGLNLPLTEFWEWSGDFM